MAIAVAGAIHLAGGEACVTMRVVPMATRPTACLRAVLHHPARCQRRTILSSSKGSITIPSTVPDQSICRILDRRSGRTRTAFAIYSPPQVILPPNNNPLVILPKRMPEACRKTRIPPNTLVAPPKNTMAALDALQRARADPQSMRTDMFSKKSVRAVRPGDVLMVTPRRGVEAFAGVCMWIKRAGVDSSFRLRNHIGRLPVEISYKIYSRNIIGIELVRRATRRPRRLKLTYLRHPKHDMGSVDGIVREWKKAKKGGTTKKEAAARKESEARKKEKSKKRKAKQAERKLAASEAGETEGAGGAGGST